MSGADVTTARDVLLATRNDAKLAELRRIVAALGLAEVRIVGLDEVEPFEEAPETGATFAENALAKARDAATATGLLAVADDSGLAVDALNGMPGVLSARWSGHGAPGRQGRRATSRWCSTSSPTSPRSAAAPRSSAPPRAAHPDGREVVVTERWPGRLVRSPRGLNGFGYDPAFVPEGESRTSAEMAPEEKDAVSHRARAFRALAPELTSLL